LSNPSTTPGQLFLGLPVQSAVENVVAHDFLDVAGVRFGAAEGFDNQFFVQTHNFSMLNLVKIWEHLSPALSPQARRGGKNGEERLFFGTQDF
jgi:hypothetical protein